MNIKMHFFTWLFSFLTSLCVGQQQEQKEDFSHGLILDEKGVLVSPGLIPDNFLEAFKTEHYRVQLAKMLELEGNVLDYSLTSLDIIEEAKNKERYQPLINNWHLYLPILSYISQVVIRQRPGQLFLEKEKELTNLPKEGYPNVRIPRLFVVFNNDGKEKISGILGKEFSRNFHYSLRQTTEFILQAGMNKNSIFYDFETGEGY